MRRGRSIPKKREKMRTEEGNKEKEERREKMGGGGGRGRHCMVLPTLLAGLKEWLG